MDALVHTTTSEVSGGGVTFRLCFSYYLCFGITSKVYVLLLEWYLSSIQGIASDYARNSESQTGTVRHWFARRQSKTAVSAQNERQSAKQLGPAEASVLRMTGP